MVFSVRVECDFVQKISLARELKSKTQSLGFKTELFWPETEINSGLDSRFLNREKKTAEIIQAEENFVKTFCYF